MCSAMPTYEYRCKDCEGSFEIVQSFSDDTLTKCPGKRAGGPVTEACFQPGKGKVVKVFASVGIAFKGDGFYKNDHGTKKPAAASTDSSASAATTASSGTESKSGDSKSGDSTSSDSKSSGSKSSEPKKAGKTTTAKSE